MWKIRVKGKWCIVNHDGEVLGTYKKESDCDDALERALYKKWECQVKSRNPSNDTTNVAQFVTDKEFSRQKLA